MATAKKRRAKKRKASETAKQRRQRLFLQHLAQTGNVSDAARVAGVGRPQVYKWRSLDAALAERWDDALVEATDALELEARRRAAEGVLEPVFHQGKPVGAIRKYSDTLLIFLMKGNNPGKYRERRELTGPDGGPIETKSTIIQVTIDDE